LEKAAYIIIKTTDPPKKNMQPNACGKNCRGTGKYRQLFLELSEIAGIFRIFLVLLGCRHRRFFFMDFKGFCTFGVVLL
jgi:hypothetical protein